MSKRISRKDAERASTVSRDAQTPKEIKYSIDDLEILLGIKLEEWQRKVVEENKENIIMRCSRKSGKTTAMAFKIVLDGMNNSDWFVCILSAGQRQSGEVFQTVLGMLYKLEVQFREKPNATGCVLFNGHRILSLPTGYTGATIRTYSFHKIYYDEAAFIADEVYKATMPCLLKHGIQKIIASTPKGSKGFFFNEWNNGVKFKRYYIPWHEIKHIPFQRLKETIEGERAIEGEKYVQQEYEALFVEQGAGLIPENLINAATADVEHDTSGKTYLGVTSSALGKNNHYIVFCNVSNSGIQITQLDVFEDSNRTEGLVSKISEIFRHTKISKIITSETSIGVGGIDRLADAFGKKKILSVESLSYDGEKISEGRRGKVKEKDLFDHLVRLMEEKKIKIRKDTLLLDALRSLDYDFKPNKENEIIISGRAKVIAEALVYSIVPTLLKRKPLLSVMGANVEPLDLRNPLSTPGDIVIYT